ADNLQQSQVVNLPQIAGLECTNAIGSLGEPQVCLCFIAPVALGNILASNNDLAGYAAVDGPGFLVKEQNLDSLRRMPHRQATLSDLVGSRQTKICKRAGLGRGKRVNEYASVDEMFLIGGKILGCRHFRCDSDCPDQWKAYSTLER